jgi:class 3 adenylate cyclase
MKTPLRRKILLYTSSVLILLIAAMLRFVSYEAGAFVQERIQAQLQEGQGRIKGVEEERLRNLKLTANLVASLSSFVALMQGKADTATIRDSLGQYQQQTGNDLLIALDDSGQVVGRTDMPEPEPVQMARDAGILKTASGTYHVAMMPADATGRLWGYVIAGARIDDSFARALQNSDTEVVILGDGILGSSIPRAQLPWKTAAEWNKIAGNDSAPQNLNIRGEDYQSVTTRLNSEGQPGPLVVIMQSQTRAMQPYRGIQIGLLVLGIIAAVCGIAISAFLSRSITAPIAKLAEGTQQVTAGNLDYRLDIRSDDEIGALAGSFNTMIQAMRERADMQKFVSLSTVEMIQSAAAKKTSAGEKVVLTIFFSDMRGFTSMTERLPPEDTVNLLNMCLSLQAGKVKKFHGDIDKYVGDCVVALFQGEDMELNAIRCAVETHRALKELNAKDSGFAPIQVGVGIVTGEVILGSIGSQDRLDYTVIGSNVNLCSRLCSQAGPGETLLAESTYEIVKGLIAAQKIAPLTVKGFTEPIPVYKMDRG